MLLELSEGPFPFSNVHLHHSLSLTVSLTHLFSFGFFTCALLCLCITCCIGLCHSKNISLTQTHQQKYTFLRSLTHSLTHTCNRLHLRGSRKNYWKDLFLSLPLPQIQSLQQPLHPRLLLVLLLCFWCCCCCCGSSFD